MVYEGNYGYKKWVEGHKGMRRMKRFGKREGNNKRLPSQGQRLGRVVATVAVGTAARTRAQQQGRCQATAGAQGFGMETEARGMALLAKASRARGPDAGQ